MRQEIKLIILVFVLVVGPAVAVSFLAARVLGSWQIVLQKRMESDAARMLDQVVQVWDKEMAEVKARIPEEPAGHATAAALAELTLIHPWISAVFIFQPGVGLIYPPVDPAGAVADESPLHGSPEASILRQAGAALVSGNTNQALIILQQMAQRDPASAAQDPDEGFYYDLIALRMTSEILGASADQTQQELLRRYLVRYETLAPLQREALTAWIENRIDAFRNSPPLLMAEWRERQRGRALTPDERGELAQDLALLYPLSPPGGWSRGKAGGRDMLVTGLRPAGRTASRSLALQLDESALIRFVNALSIRVTTNSGIRVEAGVGEGGKPLPEEVPEMPRLASRHFPFPLETFVLAAYPADSRAFFLNARLQSSLYRWGGLLLLISIGAGVWLVWRQAAVEIRQARERSNFAASVSHDLRTPLASMRMLAESLYMGKVGDEAKKLKFLGAIIKESDRLSRLTDRALYFVRYGQNALRYRFTEGDLGVLVRNAVEVFAVGVGAEVHEQIPADKPQTSDGGRGEQNDAKGDHSSIMVILQVSPDVPPVRFDGGAMEQVVFNLLDNAVKYSDRAKGTLIEVSLHVKASSTWLGVRGCWNWRVKRPPSEVVLSVRDNGVGMTDDDRRRILKPYTRGSKADTRNARGVGLGLAVCYHVVRAHQGRIEIESLPGEGSLFSVVVPAG